MLHCPYCHGWEVRDRRIGVLGTDPMAVHKAVLFRQWSPDVVFFDHDHQLEGQDRATPEALDIAVIAGKILRLEIDEDHLAGVRLADGTPVSVDAVAAGALAAQHINTDLIMKDLDNAVTAAVTAPRSEGSPAMEHTFDNEYWDRIWQGDRAEAMGSSQPNPHLVNEIRHLVPGTALDAGCGAGAEAIWLAERGWQVTAADIAAAALDRAAERVGAAGVAERVQWVQADLSTWEPDTRYDLVTTHYAHPAMPQLEFYDRAASWVSPGGTLLIVGHLHHDAAADGHGHESDGPPAAAAATAATITARLDPAQWEVATAEESHRTMSGPGRTESTIHDVVVRAVRRN